MPPFEVNAVRFGRDGLFGCEAFDFQDISIGEELCIAVPIWVGRLLFVGDPFGEKEITQLISDPAFGVAETDLERFGLFLLRKSPQIPTEVDTGVCQVGIFPEGQVPVGKIIVHRELGALGKIDGVGDVGRLGDEGDSTLIENGQAPRTDGESFSGGVHEAMFDLDEAIWVPEDFQAFLPAKLWIHFSGEAASFFGQKFKGDAVVVRGVALLVFGGGPESVPTVDHPLLGARLSHLLFVFKKNVGAVHWAEP